MDRPVLELADIVRRHGPAYRQAQRLPLEHLRPLRAIETCRTAELGGHLHRCSHCAHSRIAYNSCRNRHCPKCQGHQRHRWLQQRKQELLPVPYFHVVFTIPEQLAPIALQNKKTVYGILFAAASQTLLTLAADPRHLGARIGFFAILHTWGQNLLHHPHLHCAVPGGGLSPDGKWISSRKGFFLPVRVLSRLFRRLFLEQLRHAFEQNELSFHGSLAPLQHPQNWHDYLRPLARADWVVYAKPPFGGPGQVLEYLGRYTHRVAISNQRLLSQDDHSVQFLWKDYRHGNRQSVMTLAASEFLRRFLLHTLPPGFQRIRHYGFLSNRHRKTALAQCRRLLAHPVTALLPSPSQDRPDIHRSLVSALPWPCPSCRQGTMVIVETLPPRRFRPLARGDPS